MDNKIEEKIKNYRESVKRYISEDLPRNKDEKEAANKEREELKNVIDEEDRGENVLYQRALERLQKAETNIKNTKRAAKYSIETLITTLKERNQQIATKYMSQKPGQIQLQINFLETEKQRLEFEIIHKEQQILQTQELIEKYTEIGDYERRAELEAKVQNLRSEVTDKRNRQKECLAQIDTCKNFEEEYKRNTDLIKSYREIAKANEIEIELKTETKTEPVKTEPSKTEPVKTEPAKTEPVKTEPAKTEPAKTEPTKTKQPKVKWPDYLTEEQILEAKARDIYEPKGQEYEQFLRELGIVKGTSKKLDENIKDVKKIVISPINNTITCYYPAKESDELIPKELKGLYYTMDSVETTEKLLKQSNIELDTAIPYSALDHHVIGAMIKHSGKEATEEFSKYFKLLMGEKDSGLKIEYNLKDIYESDLSYEEIKKVMKIAKAAKKASKGAINVEKDSIGKRFVGNIKKRMESIKLLNESKKKENIDRTKTRETQHKKRTNVISKAKSIAASIGKEARVMGTRVSGQLRGEQAAVTEMGVRNIRNAFVQGLKPKVPMEHNVKNEAVTATEAPKETVEHTETKEEKTKDDLDSIINEVNAYEDNIRPVSSDVDSIIREVHSWEQGEQRLSDSSFVLKARVDESKAIKATEEKSKGQKVIIEHPDGRKEEGTRL